MHPFHLNFGDRGNTHNRQLQQRHREKNIITIFMRILVKTVPYKQTRSLLPKVNANTIVTKVDPDKDMRLTRNSEIIYIRILVNVVRELVEFGLS